MVDINNSLDARISQSNLKVTKSNALVNSRHSLTTTELRVIKSCIAKIHSMGDTKPGLITIYASEYQESFDCVNPYDDLKDATGRLFEREINYWDQDNNTYTRTRWVQSVQYDNGSGCVTLEFADKIKPQLYSLSKNFTTYHLRHIAKFKSKYSIRFYELLSQYKKLGKRTFEVEDLRQMFMLEKKYPRFADFKKYVLSPAVREINKYSDLMISDPQNIKKGRTIVKIKFDISSKPQKELDV